MQGGCTSSFVEERKEFAKYKDRYRRQSKGFPNNWRCRRFPGFPYREILRSDLLFRISRERGLHSFPTNSEGRAPGGGRERRRAYSWNTPRGRSVHRFVQIAEQTGKEIEASLFHDFSPPIYRISLTARSSMECPLVVGLLMIFPWKTIVEEPPPSRL